MVGAELERVGLLGQRLGALGREVEALELAGRFLVAAAAVRADDVLHAPDDLAARRADELAEAVFADRERRDAVAMPSRSTRSGSARPPAFGAGAAGASARPFGAGSNGGGPPACSAIR